MIGHPPLRGWLDFTRVRSCYLIIILTATPRLEEVSLTAWILGAAFFALEVYFFTILLRAWIEDRRARVASKRQWLADRLDR